MANSQDIDDFFRRCKIDNDCKVEGQKITVSLLIELLDKFSTEQIKKLNIPAVINQVCDCVIPDYDDAGGTWCRKCNAKIL